MSGVSQQTTQAHPYAFLFREVNHRLVYFVDHRTGELRYDVIPCNSATCCRAICRARAIDRRVLALRYVLRNRNARLLTLTKFEDLKTADLFADLLKNALRRAGYTAELYMVVETHAQGLVHAHLYLVSEADDAHIHELFRSRIEPQLELTEWSDFHISRSPSAQNAGYLLKEAEVFMGRHLDLNGGRLHRKSTPGFFRYAGVRSMAGCTQAERRRSRAFRAIEAVAGRVQAEKLAAPIAEAHILGALAALLLVRALRTLKLSYLRLISPLSFAGVVAEFLRVWTFCYPLKIP